MTLCLAVVPVFGEREVSLEFGPSFLECSKKETGHCPTSIGSLMLHLYGSNIICVCGDLCRLYFNLCVYSKICKCVQESCKCVFRMCVCV